MERKGMEAKIEAVRAMQERIRQNAARAGFTAQDVCKSVHYSPRHAERMFKTLTGRSIGEYLRLVRLSGGAERLLGTRDSVVEVALDAGFESHEGFSRAFFRSFRIAPGEYRRDPIPIPMFVQYPVGARDRLLHRKEELSMEKTTTVVTVTAVYRPRRKLLVLRSRFASDYLSFCDEMGCEWAGLMDSVPDKIDTCALVELPPRLVRDGTSPVCAGVEAPWSYEDAKTPENYEILALEAGELLYFQTEPYEDEEAYCEAIDAALLAAERYDPARLGYEFDFERAPKFNYGAAAATGARIALPVRKAGT